MPLNKEALMRYRVINRCLVDFKYVTMERLITACEDALDIYPVGKRTIEQDIHDMRKDKRLGFSAPIRYDRYRGAYYYSKEGYSIDNIPINREEMKSLAFAASLLDQYKNIDLLKDFTGAVQKIVDAVNIRRDLNEQPGFDFIEFENIPLSRGSEYIRFLIDAILNKKVVRLKYKKFVPEPEFETNVHPYLLKEYRNRWYLVGLNEELKELRTYGLERIQHIEINERCIYVDGDFDPREFFRNAVGIIAPRSEPELVKLKFNKRQGQYVLTLPIHSSQKLIEETDEHLIISIQASITYELVQMILGWGCDVEVMEPAGLRQQIHDELNEMLKYY